jgi:hypothetical protein
LSSVGSSRTFLSLALLAAVLFAGAAGCSRAGDGSIAVQLVYPAPTTAAAAASPASVRAASYPLDGTNRIRIRVLAPHFAPIEKWFLRSDGRGEIGGIPPGTHITVEVDEYPNVVVPSDNAAIVPLLGRGWCNGITLSAGEVKTVPVVMYDKGTIVTICGAQAVGGHGVAGDTGDGGLDNEARLENPTAVKAGPDDSIYVSTLTPGYGRVRKIDRYGYISHFAGSGPHGTITPGTAAASSPIDAVSDIDIDPSGNLYLFNVWNQIVRVDNGVVNKLVYDNGVENPAARFNLAVVNVDFVYFVNYRENKVYQVIGTPPKLDFVTATPPDDLDEPFDRLHYPILAPSSITYTSPTSSDFLIFADTDNDRIMRISLTDGKIYYLVADLVDDAVITRFSEGIDPRAMAPSRPKVVDYNPITGKIFFVEGSSNQVLYIDAAGKVHRFAGTGTPGFSGDGDLATAAELSDPRAITVDSRGNAYIAEYENHAIRMVVGGALP